MVGVWEGGVGVQIPEASRLQGCLHQLCEEGACRAFSHNHQPCSQLPRPHCVHPAVSPGSLIYGDIQRMMVKFRYSPGHHPRRQPPCPHCTLLLKAAGQGQGVSLSALLRQLPQQVQQPHLLAGRGCGRLHKCVGGWKRMRFREGCEEKLGPVGPAVAPACRRRVRRPAKWAGGGGGGGTGRGGQVRASKVAGRCWATLRVGLFAPRLENLVIFAAANQ